MSTQKDKVVEQVLDNQPEIAVKKKRIASEKQLKALEEGRLKWQQKVSEQKNVVAE